jgi:UDP:flavonoid glycosyltransferase YjiC (YdhE family)
MVVLGSHVDGLVGRSTPLRSLRLLIERYLLPTLRPRIQDLLAACEGADLLVAATTQVAASFVAELARLPLVTVTLTPITVPSAEIEPQPLAVALPAPLRRAANRASWAFGEWYVARLFDPPINRLRAEYGLRPYSNWMYTEAANSPARLVAVAVSPAFFPPPADWPPRVRETGFLYWDQPGDWREPPELAAFLAGPTPVVAVSSGSMSLEMGAAFGDFYRESVTAIRASGARVLVLGAPDGALAEPLPEDVVALPFAPFSRVYPRCAAVIHHGGIGTTAQALRAGTPQLVVPWAVDQFWTGAQAQRIGVGLTLQRRSYTSTRATPLLRDLLTNPLYRTRCSAIAREIAREDGVATLCDAIAGVLETSAEAAGA